MKKIIKRVIKKKGKSLQINESLSSRRAPHQIQWWPVPPDTAAAEVSLPEYSRAAEKIKTVYARVQKEKKECCSGKYCASCLH